MTPRDRSISNVCLCAAFRLQACDADVLGADLHVVEVRDSVGSTSPWASAVALSTWFAGYFSHGDADAVAHGHRIPKPTG